MAVDAESIGQKKSICLIGGVDSGGGAGLTRDVITAHDNGVHATTVITALTAQNSYGVSHILNTNHENLLATMSAIIADDTPGLSGFKIGMLSNRDIAKTVQLYLRDTLKNRDIPIVLDPVIHSTMGNQLLEDNAVEEVKKIVKISSLVTPNYREAHKLLDIKFSENTEVNKLAIMLFEKYKVPFLVKGGDKIGDNLTDVFVQGDCNNKPKTTTYSHTRLYRHQGKAIPLHGTGCMLSTTITCHLAKGIPLDLSVPSSISYLITKIQRAEKIMKNNMLYLI